MTDEVNTPTQLTNDDARVQLAALDLEHRGTVIRHESLSIENWPFPAMIREQFRE
jgi:hypothetical protein